MYTANIMHLDKFDFRRIVFASDGRFGFGAMPQPPDGRQQPWARGLRHSAGLMFEGVAANGVPMQYVSADDWAVVVEGAVEGMRAWVWKKGWCRRWRWRSW